MSTTPDPFDGMTKEQLLAVLKRFVKADRPQMTVGQVINAYLRSVEERTKRGDFSADGLAVIQHRLQQFKAAHGPKTIADCRQHDLTAFLADNPQWVSGYTQLGAATAVCVCFSWAQKEGLIDASPFRRPSNMAEMKPRRPCEPAEYVALMRFGNRALRRILYYLRKTGARTCEARQLTWDQVNLDDDNPHCRLETHKTFKKTRCARIIGLDNGTARFLRALKRQAPPHTDRVFLNSNGEPWTRDCLVSAFRRVRARAGLSSDVENRISAYGLRHLYVVSYIRAGMTSRQIADQVGHQTTTLIDKIYGKTTRQNLAHLGKIANDATRLRLRERPKAQPRKETP